MLEAIISQGANGDPVRVPAAAALRSVMVPIYKFYLLTRRGGAHTLASLAELQRGIYHLLRNVSGAYPLWLFTKPKFHHTSHLLLAAAATPMALLSAEQQEGQNKIIRRCYLASNFVNLPKTLAVELASRINTRILLACHGQPPGLSHDPPPPHSPSHHSLRRQQAAGVPAGAGPPHPGQPLAQAHGGAAPAPPAVEGARARRQPAAARPGHQGGRRQHWQPRRALQVPRTEVHLARLALPAHGRAPGTEGGAKSREGGRFETRLTPSPQAYASNNIFLSVAGNDERYVARGALGETYVKVVAFLRANDAGRPDVVVRRPGD